MKRYPDMDVAESPLELIGRTPMVRLGQIGPDLRCDFVAKLETTNPGGSSKDRPALTMVLAAEQEGLLGPGSTIVEPTSGNTGVGLAIVAAQRGYKCIFVMSDKMAPEKIDLLRAYGAEVVVCPTAVAPEHPDSYYSTAERLTRDRMLARALLGLPIIAAAHPRDVGLVRLAGLRRARGSFAHFDPVVRFAAEKHLRSASLEEIAQRVAEQ